MNLNIKANIIVMIANDATEFRTSSAPVAPNSNVITLNTGLQRYRPNCACQKVPNPG
jgi:hypothetical protein